MLSHSCVIRFFFFFFVDDVKIPLSHVCNLSKIQKTGSNILTRALGKEGLASLVLTASSLALTGRKRAPFLNALLHRAFAHCASNEAGSHFIFCAYWPGAQVYLSREWVINMDLGKCLNFKTLHLSYNRITHYYITKMQSQG